jgi:hypothetical protein
MRPHKYFIILVAMAFLWPSRACMGTALPHLRIPELVRQSDVVVVADVSDIKAVGLDSIIFNGVALPGQRYRVESATLYRLVGSCPDQFTVEFVLPYSSNGYQYVKRGTRMLFLKKSGRAYTPTNPYYPDLPALRSVPIEMEGKDGADLVIAELAAVVASADASDAEKLEVLVRSYAIPDDNKLFLDHLVVAVRNTADPDLRSRLQSMLLSRNDVSELQDVCDALLAGALPAHQKQLLLDGVRRQLSNEKAVPGLVRLLQSHDPEVKVATAQGLWHTASTSSIPVLTKALDDENAEVRYYAIRGLADATGQPQWGPGPAEYEAHRDKYRQHWLEWASQNVSPPSRD